MHSVSIPVVGEWLADALIQCSILLALVLLVERLFKEMSAARRHLVLLAGAFGIPMIAVAAAFMPAWQTTPAVETIETAAPVFISREILIGEGSPLLPGEAQTNVNSREETTPFNWAGLPLKVWAAGVVVCWLRLLSGICMLARLRGKCRRTGKFDEMLVKEAQLRRIPEIIIASGRSMPMTWGVIHHTILLPAEANEWPESRVRRILRHELAHVRRGDCVKSWLAEICLLLLWFHPLAWMTRRALNRTREAACDDLAINGDTREAGLYARDLVDVVSFCGESRRASGMSFALAMGAPETRRLKQRLEDILDESRDRSPVSRRAIFGITPFWLLLVCALGMVTAFRAVPAQEAKKEDNTITTRKYALVPEHLDMLLFSERLEKVSSGSIHDPFKADTFSTVRGSDLPFDAIEFAAASRRGLIERFGLKISSADPVKITFTDRYTMQVSAPQQIHDGVTWALDSLMNKATVFVRTYFFDYENPESISKYLSADISKTVSISADQFKQLRIDIEKAGGKLRSMPSVATRSGQRAKVEMIREFIYPTEYDPPTFPKDSTQEGREKSGMFAVTPANPTAFEVRPVGLTMEVDPVLFQDGTVELSVLIEDVSFLGIINYGSPINGSVRTGGVDKSVVITENRIVMPVFETEKLSTQVKVEPGKYLLLSGFGRKANDPMKQLKITPAEGSNSKPAVQNFENLEKKNRFFVIEAYPVEGDGE